MPTWTWQSCAATAGTCLLLFAPSVQAEPTLTGLVEKQLDFGFASDAAFAESSETSPMPSTDSQSSEVPPEEPAMLAYDDGQPIPPGYRVRRTHSTGLIVSGSIIFGVPYFLSVAASGRDAFRLIPVAGPFISLTTEETCEIDCGLYAGNEAFLIGNGLAQTTGAVLLVLGIVMEDVYLERTNALGARILPTRIGSGYGVGALGYF